MADLPSGRISHQSSGRLRLRIPEKRRDDGYFQAVAAELSDWETVDRVEVNPLTASVLILFRDADALFAELERRNRLFSIAADPQQVSGTQRKLLTDRVTGLWRQGDKALRRFSGGQTDLRSAAFAVLVATAAYQALRGRIFPPAGTLLWDAGEMLKIWQAALDDGDGGGKQRAAAGD